MGSTPIGAFVEPLVLKVSSPAAPLHGLAQKPLRYQFSSNPIPLPSCPPPSSKMRFALVAFILLLAGVAEGGKTMPRNAPIPAPLPDAVSCPEPCSGALPSTAPQALQGAHPGSEYGAKPGNPHGGHPRLGVAKHKDPRKAKAAESARKAAERARKAAAEVRPFLLRLLTHPTQRSPHLLVQAFAAAAPGTAAAEVRTLRPPMHVAPHA